MTIDDFKEKLAEEHAGQFHRDNGGNIRHRKICTSNDDQCCPILSLFHNQREKLPEYFKLFFVNSHAAQIADYFGLTKTDALTLMRVADDEYSDDNEPALAELRGWMLTTLCGETT